MKLHNHNYSIMTLKHTLILICFASTYLSAEWTNWWGPNNNLTTEHEAFPSKFSNSDNVVWSIEIPGQGTSTPAIWNDTLYITSMKNGMDTLFALNLDGKKKWDAKIGIGEEGSHRQGTGANPSPVVDDSGVYVYFKSASLAKFSHSGKEIWKVDRVTGANIESNDAYTTPLIAAVDGQRQLIVWGADQLSGHSLKNGKAIWTCGDFNPTNHKNWRTIASHTIVGDIAVVPYGRGYAVAAIKMSDKGDITSKSRLWEIERIGPDVPTPTVHGDSTIVLTDRGVITAINLESGNIAWESSLPRTKDKFFASPIISGERMICCRDDGTVFVCGLSKGGIEVLSENNMGEAVIATPVPHDDKLYVRTASTLYCIGKSS